MTSLSIHEIIAMLEAHLKTLNSIAATQQHQPALSTQLQAFALWQTHQHLEEMQDLAAMLKPQHAHWSQTRIATEATFVRLDTAFKAFVQHLEPVVAHSKQLQLEARVTTGFLGQDSSWQDPKTGQYNHPIDHLPLFAELVQGHLEDANGLLATLRDTPLRPSIFDQGTLDRIDQNYDIEAAETIKSYAWQIKKWQKLKLTDVQKQHLNTLLEQLAEYQQKVNEVRAFSHKVRRRFGA
jgi:hypothetical protein